MEDDTQQFTKPTPADTSRIGGVSLRGWIAVIVILTVCAMSLLALEIKEPLYTLAGLIVGFYFGQNQTKK